MKIYDKKKRFSHREGRGHLYFWTFPEYCFLFVIASTISVYKTRIISSYITSFVYQPLHPVCNTDCHWSVCNTDCHRSVCDTDCHWSVCDTDCHRSFQALFSCFWQQQQLDKKPTPGEIFRWDIVSQKTLKIGQILVSSPPVFHYCKFLCSIIVWMLAVG